jgi:glyoxylase-like metal-dependent hydrolase (beta-lactamase superfamily II)
VRPNDASPRQTSVYFLGTGGWLPSGSRETSCYAVRDGSDLLLLDAGTGLRRLITDPSICQDVTRIDVALSHFHLDHVIGLSYLDALEPSIDRHVWGAGKWLYGADSNSILAQLLLPPTVPRRKRAFSVAPMI